MIYDLIIKGGNVVLKDKVIKNDIAILNGKIVAIAETIDHKAEQIIDASEQYVMPGMIDTHVHICEPGRTEWEGFLTGTKALAAGGTTCYADMPLNALPATVDRHTLQLKAKRPTGKIISIMHFMAVLLQAILKDLKSFQMKELSHLNALCPHAEQIIPMIFPMWMIIPFLRG